MAIWKWFAVPQYSFADERMNKELLGSLPLSEDGSPVTHYASLHQRKAHYFWWSNRPFCTHCGQRTNVWRACSETNTNYECMQCGAFRVKHISLMSESEVTAHNTQQDFGNWETETPCSSSTSATPSFQEILFNQMTSIFQYMGDRLRLELHPDAWRAALMLAKLLGLDCLPPKNRINLEAFGLEDGSVIDPDVVSCAYIGTRVLDRNAMCWGAFRYWKDVSWKRTQAISRVVLVESMPPPDWAAVLPLLWSEELVARSLTRAVRRKLKDEKDYFFGLFSLLHEVVHPNAIAAAYAFLRVPRVRRTYNFEYWDKLYGEDFREALKGLDVGKKLNVHGLPLAEFVKSQEAQSCDALNQSLNDTPAAVEGKDKKLAGNLTRQHKAQELEARFRLIRIQQQQRFAFITSNGTRCSYGYVLVNEEMMGRLLEGVDFAEELQPIRDVLRTQMEEHLSVEQRLDYDPNQLLIVSSLDADFQFLSLSNLEEQKAYRMNDLALDEACKAEVVATISARLTPILSALDSFNDAELRLQLILWNELAVLLDKPFCTEDLSDVSSRGAMLDLLTQHITKFWRDYDGDGVEVARPAMRKMVISNACFCFDVAQELPELSPVASYEMDGPHGHALLQGQARQLFRCMKAVEFYLGEGVWGECPALLCCHPTWAMLENAENRVLLQFVMAASRMVEPLLGQDRDTFQLMEPAAGSACRLQEQELDGQAAVPHRHRLGDSSLPLAGSAQQVVPFLQQLLSNEEVCQPAADLGQCSTSSQVVATLNALGMPFCVEETVFNKAVEVVRAKRKFCWMYRPIYKKGPLQPWTWSCGKHFGQKQVRGKRYALYSVCLLAPPEKVAAFRTDLVQQGSPLGNVQSAFCGGGDVLEAAAASPSGTDPSASPRPKVRRLLPLTPDNKAALRSPSKEPEGLSLAGFETSGQLRERCRAVALELVPAAEAMLADQTLCRAPTSLGECSTALEVGRQLLRRLDARPIGVKFDAVVPFLLEQLCDKGVLSRLEMDSTGAPLQYTRHPYRCAKRRDPQSGRSSDLWSVHFLQSTEAPASALPAAGSESCMGPILEALMPPPNPVAVLSATQPEPDPQPAAKEFLSDRSRKKQKRKRAALEAGEVEEKVAEDPLPTVAASPSPPAGDTKQQCRAYVEAVLPAVRHALQQPEDWGRRPPRTLDDCLTTHELGRRLLVKVGPLPSWINDQLAMAAIIHRLLKDGLVHHAGLGEGREVVAVRRAGAAHREDPISGKPCRLLFVTNPDSQQPATEPSSEDRIRKKRKRTRAELEAGEAEEKAAAPTAAQPASSLADVKQQCRAYVEAVLPAVRHALLQPEGWGHRPPRTLDDCLTTQEFGRRLLALTGPHPAHLEAEAVTAAVLKRVVEEGLVHRAGLGEDGTVVAVWRADVARREDAVSGKSCQLLFVSPCKATTKPR
eukprot:EG_transcript_437